VNELRFQAIETDNDTASVTQAIAVECQRTFTAWRQNDNLSGAALILSEYSANRH